MGLYDLPVWLTTTLGAVILLAYFSLVFYKENLWSRWAEYLIVGLGVGYGAVNTTYSLYTSAIEPLVAGDILKIVPIIIGLLAYTQFTRKPEIRWFLRWPLVFVTSIGLALSLTGVPLTYFIVQLRAIAVPLTTGSAFEIFNAIVILVGVVTTLSYFTFTRQHKGVLGVSAQVGRYFMMTAFGAGMGMAFLSQASFIINVVLFFLKDWLHLIP